jgi:hypothetical protein
MRGFILLLVALILSIAILPIGFAFQVVVSLFRAIDSYLFRIAKSLDQHGNTVCEELFNQLLIKKKDIPFGDMDRTISYVLAQNRGNLTLLGKALAWLLNAIDEGHLDKVND